MAYILQHRRDTLANWQSVNPVLADAEIGFILDKDENGRQKSSLYKIGDGVHAWNDLPMFGFGGNIYENFEGDDLSSSVASRQAILDKLNEKLDASLVQYISPESGEYFGDLYNDPENPLTWEQMQPYMEQQIVSRWALAKEFQQIWDDFSDNEERINSLVYDVQGKDDPLEGYQPGLKDNVTLTMQQVELLKAFADTCGPVVDGLVETVNVHSSDIGTLRTDTDNLITDMEDIKSKVATAESDIETLKANPKSQILSEESFSDLTPEDYEENTLYFIYKEEINQ